MKFFFAKTDSLYKIFKTLEKIPTGRKVEIFIDPEHALFDNQWRGKQIKEILENKHIDAVFTTKQAKSRTFFQSVGLAVNHVQQRNIEKVASIFYLFFFNIKKFHLHTYESKRYVFVLIFFFETLLIGLILWLIISLILPSAKITLKSAEDSEVLIYNFRYYPAQETGFLQTSRYLNIPYYTGSIDYKYDLIISTANIKHITNPSKGYIKIYNSKPQSYSLVATTRFITADGLVFRARDDFTIATGSQKYPSETVISVQADEKDEQNQIIGIRGNIPMHTQMRIKNLNESYYLKELWAESIESFQGGTTQSIGSVTDKDIAILTGKLIEQVYKQKMNIVNQYFSIPDGILLPFESITTTSFNEILVEQKEGVDTPTVKGTAYITYTFHYIYRKDLLKAFTTYLNERPSEKIQILSIDKSSIKFIKDSSSFEEGEIKKNGNTFIIPTQI
ncbi:MAG: hypothetical protein LBD75_05670, partial [Candidatus Peribacteria bacterium]|nr:hypothetical protein [Candidatus Peribacteria bacterium]